MSLSIQPTLASVNFAEAVTQIANWCGRQVVALSSAITTGAKAGYGYAKIAGSATWAFAQKVYAAAIFYLAKAVAFVAHYSSVAMQNIRLGAQTLIALAKANPQLAGISAALTALFLAAVIYNSCKD